MVEYAHTRASLVEFLNKYSQNSDRSKLDDLSFVSKYECHYLRYNSSTKNCHALIYLVFG